MPDEIQCHKGKYRLRLNPATRYDFHQLFKACLQSASENKQPSPTREKQASSNETRPRRNLQEGTG